ncbi:MAG: glycosyltransferase, partial [Gemmatimonadaceae bacterium]
MPPPPAEPLVSVVIPCYAQAHFLADAIESVMGQTYRHFEIIVVNDGSPDVEQMEQVLRGYGERVRYVKQANAGLSGAHNAGLRLAQGEFVVCLDSDDRLLPNALRTGVTAWSEFPTTGLVFGYNRLINVHGEPLDRTRVRVSDGSYTAMLEQNTIGCPINVMLRRCTVMEVGAFSTELTHSEDYELFLRLTRLFGAHCHGQLVAEYRMHDANMSKNHQGMLAGVLKTLEMQEEWVRGDAALERALHRGRSNAWEIFDCDPMIWHFAQDVKSGRWLKAAAAAARLTFKYPRKFSAVLRQRTKRALRSALG